MKSTVIPFIGEIDVTKGFGLLFWPVALMFIYGFTNAVNLTDGIDGLASTVTLVVACAFMLASGFLYNMGINAMSAALAGACVGFIVWNAKPAQVFMGDTGSMFIGYILAVSGLCINARTISVASIGIPLLACGLPVLDICLAVWRPIERVAGGGLIGRACRFVGMRGLLLICLAMYLPLDSAVRWVSDAGYLPSLMASVWDECLMLAAFAYILWHMAMKRAPVFCSDTGSVPAACDASRISGTP